MEPGSRLGPYEIIGRIGAGGMGEVYEAEDTRLGRRIALKTLPADLTDDPARRARFEREARAAAALDHPAIATVHSIEEEAGVPFITFQLVKGGTLDSAIPEGGMALDDFLDLVEPIVDAIAAAHGAGVVHRDLKPSNIVVDPSGHPSVLDFGIAVQAFGDPGGPSSDDTPADAATRLTEDGTVMGTVTHMSPEQAAGRATDHRADLFSLGVVMYQMLTSQLPFRGSGRAELLAALLRDEPTPLSRYRTDVPVALVELVDRCLEKRPECRTQSAEEIADALVSVRSAVTTPGSTAGGMHRSWYRRSLWSGVVAAGLAAVAWFVVSGRSDRITIADTRPLTREPGIELYPAISPDGTMVAYAAGQRGTTAIHVRQLEGSGRPIVVSSAVDGDHRGPSWSPDGTRVAFVASRGGASEVYSVPALGGAARRHLSLPDTPIVTVDWSPDGATLAYSGNAAISLLDLDSGASRVLVDAYLPHSLDWSPDGSRLAFVSGNPYSVYGAVDLGNRAPTSIWTVGRANGIAVRVTRDDSLDLAPTWTSDGRHLLFLSDRGGRGDLYRVRLNAAAEPIGSPTGITTGLGAHTLDVAPDDGRLVYSTLEFRSNLRSLPIPGDPATDEEPTTVTTGNQVIETVAVSPDGEWLAFDSDRSGNFEIYRVPVGGGEPEQITDDPQDDFHPDWSPDGEWLAFHSFRGGTRDIWIMPATGGVARQVTTDVSHERGPRWAPDGRRIVFFADGTGRQELYVVAREGDDWGEPRQLTTGGGIHPRWSPDGTTIGYVVGSPRHPRSAQRYELRLVAPNGEPRSTLVRTTDPAAAVPETLAWSADSGIVYYSTVDQQGTVSLWSIPASGGTPRELVRFDRPDRRSNRHEFTAGDGRFYFTLAEHEADLWSARIGEER